MSVGGVLVGLLGNPACLNEVVDLAWQCALEAGLGSGGDCVEVGMWALTTTRVLRHCARTTRITFSKESGVGAEVQGTYSQTEE